MLCEEGHFSDSLWQSLSLSSHSSLVTGLWGEARSRSWGLEQKEGNTCSPVPAESYSETAVLSSNTVSFVTFFCSWISPCPYPLCPHPPEPSLVEHHISIAAYEDEKQKIFQVINDHFLWFFCHCSHHIFVKKSIKTPCLKQQQSKQRWHLIIILLDLLWAPDNVPINNNCQIYFGSFEVSLRFQWNVQY